MENELNSSRIAIMSAILALSAAPIALISIWLSTVVLLITVSVALIKGWQSRRKLLGKISLVLASLTVIISCLNLVRFFIM